ncbi:Uncharacterized protein BP5553_02514 [Venustampulla echinocandica]|uniref:Uncharacterized protein n=1 Tax=Venustampulla echinocandica TaxID=2656787 RepID=A0A370U430_9HELO|nr:Uncharacterized protein BP5553_02514 [Venustampulla echinocandica]RDL42535.1 Uncharacterized protein BP5553_02514 [Venustampulla echinocandica]
MVDRAQATNTNRVRKRKAESQDNNERLSKRLSLLNLDRSGNELYIPVERRPITSTSASPSASTSTTKPKPRIHEPDSDVMPLDDTKHKVYIYDLDAELSDSSESDDNKVAFLPDIEKHIREWRIPPAVLANGGGQSALNNQLVLYNIPRSLSIPEEQDTVRKAIIEARARARAKQNQKPVEVESSQPASTPGNRSVNNTNWYRPVVKNPPAAPIDTEVMDEEPIVPSTEAIIEDPDAMDLG